MVVVVDHGDGGGARAVRADGRNGEDGLVELLGSGLHRVDRLAPADREGDVGIAKCPTRNKRVDGGLGGIGAVDDLVEDLHVCTIECGADTRRRSGEGAASTYQDDGFCLVGGEYRGDRLEAILANRIAAHLNGAHVTSLTSCRS